MGRSHFSFDGERKVCKRKPAARRLREKALYCPFLKEGVRNVARSIVGEITPTFVRARAHSYPLSKRARLFSSAAYRRSAPPRLAIDRLKWRCLRGFGAARMISQCGKTGLIFLLGWRRAYSSSVAVDILDISVTQQMPAWFQIHAGICCEPEGLAPDGGLFYLTNKESTLDPRAARSVAERRPWGRKRRKHEAFRRVFP